jgi:hypothetical protein
VTAVSEKQDIEMPNKEEAVKLITEVELVIDAIKNGEMEGEYLEF